MKVKLNEMQNYLGQKSYMKARKKTTCLPGDSK